MPKGRTVPDPPASEPRREGPSLDDAELQRLYDALLDRLAVIFDRHERRVWDRYTAKVNQQGRAARQTPEYVRLVGKAERDPIAGPLMQGLIKRMAELDKEP